MAIAQHFDEVRVTGVSDGQKYGRRYGPSVLLKVLEETEASGSFNREVATITITGPWRVTEPAPFRKPWWRRW